MARRTPSREIQAFVGEQFGHRFYVACVSIAELRKWTLRESATASKKSPGEGDRLAMSPVVLATNQTLHASASKTGGSVVTLLLPADHAFTVLGGHRTIRVFAEISNASDSVTVEIHDDFDDAALTQFASKNRNVIGDEHRRRRSVLDDRGDWMIVTRQTIDQVRVFTGRVDMAKTALSNRSRNLFTFSAIHQANMQLPGDRKHQSVAERVDIAVQFWNKVAANMPDWQAASAETLSPAEYRSEFVCAHGIALAGLARLGRSLLADFPKTWQSKLKKLRTINWRRANTATWEGQAMIAGRLSKASTCVVLTGNLLKAALGLQFSEYENDVETSSQKPKI